MADMQMEMALFDAAQDAAEAATARRMLVNTYIIRAVNLCVDRGILEQALRVPITITDRGHRSAAVLDVSEEELREMFDNLLLHDYINPSVVYDDVFNGVVSKGEVLH